MSSPTDQPDDWVPCQAGELTALGNRLRDAERREQTTHLVRSGGTALGLLLVCVASVWWLTSGNSPPGGITCQQCASHFDDYRDHLADNAAIDASMADSMAAHLAACPLCRREFESRFPGLLTKLLRESGTRLASFDARWAATWFAGLGETPATVPLRS